MAAAPSGAQVPASTGKTTAAPASTNWLQPQTNKQIQQQATTTIKTAYAPVFQQLDQQAKQAQGLSDKRTADNKYYQSWLDTQMSALQSHADAAQGQLTTMMQGFQAQQSQLYSGQAGQLVGAADARAGNVSNDANSNAFGEQLHQNQQYNEGILNSAGQQATAGMMTANDQLSGARANDFAEVQDSQRKNLADLNTALTKIGDARTVDQTKETGDIAKEVSRLQGVSINVAENNRNYAAAAQKLGISAANISSEIQNRNATQSLNQKKLNLDLTKAQLAQMNSDRNYQLNQDKYNSATAKDLYERQHGLGPYRANKTSSLSQTSQNSIFQHIDKLGATMNDLVNNYGLTPQQAYHVALNGGPVQIGTRTQTQPNGKKISVPTYKNFTGDGNAQIVNAAYNAVRNGGTGLTPGDVAALKKMGITDPSTRYKVA
jgi:hypothetical protein